MVNIKENINFIILWSPKSRSIYLSINLRLCMCAHVCECGCVWLITWRCHSCLEVPVHWWHVKELNILERSLEMNIHTHSESSVCVLYGLFNLITDVEIGAGECSGNTI